jgi:hypothetical protein
MRMAGGSSRYASDSYRIEYSSATVGTIERPRRTASPIVWSADGSAIVPTYLVQAGYPSLFPVRPGSGEAPVQLTTDATYGAYRHAYDHATSLYGNVLMFEVRLGRTILTCPRWMVGAFWLVKRPPSRRRLVYVQNWLSEVKDALRRSR